MNNSELNFRNEKLHVIELLLKNNNASVLEKIKTILTEDPLPSLSEAEIELRAQESENAIANGDVLSLEDFEKEVQGWK